MTKDDDIENEHCKFPRNETSFSSIEELTLSQEQGLLKLVKRLTSTFEIPSFPNEILEQSIPEIKQALDYYSSNRWEKKPELYFLEPKNLPLLGISAPIPLSDGQVREVSFMTKFESVNDNYRNRLKGFKHSKIAKAKHWMHTSEKPLGCVVAVHGWMLGDQKASALTLVPGFFYRMGLDVIVVELPLHGSRSPEEYTPLNLFPSLDPAVTNESFAQSIFELREVISWVKDELSCPVIGLGLSLGAQTIALLSSIMALDAVICVAPMVSLSSFIWQQVVGTTLEQTLIKAGLDKTLIDEGFAVTAPLSYSPKIDKDRMMIVAGKNDVIVPSHHATELWEYWQKPKIHWLDDGHIEQLVAPGTGHVIHGFLRDLGLALENLKLTGRVK